MYFSANLNINFRCPEILSFRPSILGGYHSKFRFSGIDIFDFCPPIIGGLGKKYGFSVKAQLLGSCMGFNFEMERVRVNTFVGLRRFQQNFRCKYTPYL